MFEIQVNAVRSTPASFIRTPVILFDVKVRVFCKATSVHVFPPLYSSAGKVHVLTEKVTERKKYRYYRRRYLLDLMLSQKGAVGAH